MFVALLDLLLEYSLQSSRGRRSSVVHEDPDPNYERPTNRRSKIEAKRGMRTNLFHPLLSQIPLEINDQLLPCPLALDTFWRSNHLDSVGVDAKVLFGLPVLAPGVVDDVLELRVDGGEGQTGVSAFDDHVDVGEDAGHVVHEGGHMTGEPGLTGIRVVESKLGGEGDDGHVWWWGRWRPAG